MADQPLSRLRVGRAGDPVDQRQRLRKVRLLGQHAERGRLEICGFQPRRQGGKPLVANASERKAQCRQDGVFAAVAGFGVAPAHQLADDPVIAVRNDHRPKAGSAGLPQHRSGWGPGRQLADEHGAIRGRGLRQFQFVDAFRRMCARLKRMDKRPGGRVIESGIADLQVGRVGAEPVAPETRRVGAFGDQEVSRRGNQRCNSAAHGRRPGGAGRQRRKCEAQCARNHHRQV